MSHLFEGKICDEQLLVDLSNKIELYGFEKCVEVYSQAIPQEWSKTIYVHLVDLLYENGKPSKEEALMMDLAYTALDIPPDEALEISRVIGYKHILENP